MRGRLWYGLLCFLFAGCTSTPPQATAQDRSAALEAAVACLHAAAIKLDDGKSGASVVALGLKPMCAAQFARARDIYAQTLNLEAAAMFHRTDDQSFMEQATAAVLIERANRRK